MLTFRSLLTLLIFCIWFENLFAQVSTNINNNIPIKQQGKFLKSYSSDMINYSVGQKNLDSLIELDKKWMSESSGERPFEIAIPVAVDINVAKLMKWVEEDSILYGKYTIRQLQAKSSSINFDQFHLPLNSEMYIYNENGNMITGPITEKENNENKLWGSWVYEGEYITIEIKTPQATLKQLSLHASNIAYGYKSIYKSEVRNFGFAAPCHINVICPLGTGWEAERNSVALLLRGDGSSLCTGAMLMNACGSNRPFFLTANHCFTGENVATWRFNFQAWSATCTPSQNSSGITYNGSTHRANWSGTDFCLVELNNIPAASSGIRYAGWNRSTTGITQTTIIQHPAGDVMKVARDINAPIFSSFSGASCWQLGLDQGATEGGTSGAPYFDQNHRIIGQHFGVNDAHLPICSRVNKFGGRFDQSWTGGGTNATRLSNWLDPNNTGSLTTNTTNVNALSNLNNIGISNNPGFCTSGSYSVTGLPAGATVNWNASPAGYVNFSCSTCPSTTVSQVGSNSGKVTLTATVNFCGITSSTSKTISVGLPNSSQFQIYSDGPTVCANVPVDFGAFYGSLDWCSITQTGATNVEWSVSPTPLQIINNSGNGVCPGVNNAGIEIKFANLGYSYQANVRFRTQNACGWSSWSNSYVVSVVNGMCGGGMFSVYPNPSNGIVNIERQDKSDLTTLDEFKISKVRIFDPIGNLKKEWTFGTNGSQVQINTSGLLPGVYTLEIVTSKNKLERQKLMVK